MYRIHFTVEDLARTRVAQAPPPLWELSVAVRHLQEDNNSVRFAAWRRRALAGLLPQARLVLELTPILGWLPTFMAPAELGSPQEMLERGRSTPRSEIRRSLASVAERQPLPAWTQHLAGDHRLLRQFLTGLENVHNQLLAPYWPQVTTLTTADQTARLREAATSGMERMFALLSPRRIRWNLPVLEIAMVSGREGELHLEGRGLLMVPSVFSCGAPLIEPHAQPQPTLTYPAGLAEQSRALPLYSPPARPASPAAPSSLASVLGRTRADVLHTIAEHPACSTKQLAALVGIAQASASEHATSLREAGLVHTVRHRNAALHSPTSVGIALLNASPAVPSGYRA
ncbi:winged helix-turn-helix domain-containing protein [Streptomyces palmae]|uniref:ArsR family transcriptional regulator n=1 Tax=Streptomyces palmae TaxID=1701085 RepID=A0A4Z0HGT0_9ACTN|nr:winged helix-turn-helix domain-containing protein [Streptomyces palmae]TGB19613.1 ArsR family transcriptional regulator [Streptomyces palmae]